MDWKRLYEYGQKGHDYGLMRFLVFFLCLLIAPAALASERPNIVFILTDNHGDWTLGCYGNPDIATPNIDRMAQEGARFVNSFCNNAVCSPTRATYLTGLMPSQHGVHNFLRQTPLQIGPEARNTLGEFTSLPEILGRNGYACGLVGKWHLGNNEVPNEALDDYWITMPHGGTSTFHGARVIENGEIREEPEYLTDFWTKHALQFIDEQSTAENAEKPFFLFLSYNGPYGLSRYQLKPANTRWTPHYAEKEMASFPRGVIHPWEYNNREYFGNLTSIRRYGEELSAIDDGVGSILGKLKALRLDENTLVVFAADQGWAGGQHGVWGMGDHTRPLNAWEYSMRIPLIFRQPGRIAAGLEPEIHVSNYDFVPSVLGYLGLESELPKKPLSPGRDYSPALVGKTVPEWEDTVFYEYENLRCVRSGNWKLVERYKEAYDELFDLANDPDELHNLHGNPDVAEKQIELQGKLNAFFEKYVSEKYDLWNGGESQPKTILWGKEAETRQAEYAAKQGTLVSPIDPSWNPPVIELADGFVAEVAAAPPLVEHPIMANFDDRGRLFVSENAGLNLKKDELAKQKPNSVRMLEDTNGDGLFDKSTVFADNLTFPQGALWVQDALYVMSPPSLWRFEDTDGDGVADEREELVTGLDYTGNAADVHGPFLHPNGRIFWVHGRKGHEVFDLDTGELVSAGKGARVWSCRVDGSDVEVFAGGGMDNPVEIDFTETGEILGTVNLFYGRPRGDTLTHWIRGGVYPRRDQEAVTSEFIRTGPLLGEVYNFGHVAVSGMTRYRTGALADDWKDNLLVAHFNTQKITRTPISRKGSTYSAGETETIFQINNPDAHLTDVLESPNGDLYALDTGGWFRIGCPTSQIAKPDVPGAIYRIRKAGPIDKKADPFGNEINWEKSTAEKVSSYLDHPNFHLQERARATLAGFGDPALPELRRILEDPEASVLAKQNSIWTLARLRFSHSTDLILTALNDSDPDVTSSACNAVAATRDWRTIANNSADEASVEIQRNHQIVQKLADLVRSESEAPYLQRQAAAALGRMGDPAAAPALIAVLGRETTDRFLEHSLLYSLISIGDSDALRDTLKNGNPSQRAAALTALDQLESDLGVLSVLPHLDSEDEGLRGTATNIALTKETWDAALANRFLDWLMEADEANEISEFRLEAIRKIAPHFLETPPMQSFLVEFMEREELEQEGYAIIADSPLKELPEVLAPTFTRLFESSTPSGMKIALEALAVARTDRFVSEVTNIANDDTYPAEVRVRALKVLDKENAPISTKAFALLVEMLGESSTPAGRNEAAQLVSKAKLTSEQLTELARMTLFAGPIDLPILMGAFQSNRTPEIGTILADRLPKAPGFGALAPSETRRFFSRYPIEVQEAIAPAIAGLFSREEQREERLRDLAKDLDKGDPKQGQKVFSSGKGACITCHVIQNEGRAIGPNLSTIGRIREPRDLLESIVYPSESLARDFELFAVELNDQQILSGLIQREDENTIHLTTASGESLKLARHLIKKITSVPTSLMPPGLDQTMSRQELLNLVSWLDSLE